MDPKIKIRSRKQPYDDYLKSPLWNIIKNEIKELEENGDLAITTDPYYVVGSLVKSIKDASLTPQENSGRPASTKKALKKCKN